MAMVYLDSDWWWYMAMVYVDSDWWLYMAAAMYTMGVVVYGSGDVYGGVVVYGNDDDDGAAAAWQPVNRTRNSN